MTQTKSGPRMLAILSVITVIVTVGVLALNKGNFSGGPEYRCKTPTVEVEFHAGADPRLPLDIEWFSTGNYPGETHVRTQSWLTVEQATCPGTATLHVESRRESGRVNCSIWVNNSAIIGDEFVGRGVCDVVVKLIAA